MKRTAEFAHAFAHSRNADAQSDRHIGAGMHIFREPFAVILNF
jgi:hypothetical protein